MKITFERYDLDNSLHSIQCTSDCGDFHFSINIEEKSVRIEMGGDYGTSLSYQSEYLHDKQVLELAKVLLNTL